MEAHQRSFKLEIFATFVRKARLNKRHLIPDRIQLLGASEMTTDNPQVPWTDEQWARVNKVVQEEASRARMAATFLPLLGPLPGDTDFVGQELIPRRIAITIQDRDVIQLATLQVKVPCAVRKWQIRR